jgi:hypothetical protein
MLALAFACSSDSNATPVSPEIVGLEAVTAETSGLEAVTAETAQWTQVCHLIQRTARNGETGEFAFEVRRVRPQNVLKHLWHGDVQNACSDAMAVGENCWSCAVPSG